MHTSFRDQVVLVTGSSWGIGKGAALFFAECGARLVLASRNEHANTELLKRIKEHGAQGIFVQTDVSKDDQVQKMVKEAVDHFGTINICHQ